MYKLANLFLSKYFQRQTDLINPAELNSQCYLCNSNCLVEVFHENFNHKDFRSEAYRCTSLEHKSKPQVLNCLICDLSFVPQKSYPMDIDKIYSEVEDPIYLENKESRYKTFQESLAQISPYLPDKEGNLIEGGSYCGIFLDTFQKKIPWLGLHWCGAIKMGL